MPPLLWNLSVSNDTFPPFNYLLPVGCLGENWDLDFYAQKLQNLVLKTSQDYFNLMSTISKTTPVEQVYSIYVHLTTRSLSRCSTYSTYTSQNIFSTQKFPQNAYQTYLLVLRFICIRHIFLSPLTLLGLQNS